MNWTTYNSAGAALSQSLTDMPVGTITGYAGATAPSGWLLCDGSAVSRTTYAELFGVVSTTYGSGDGSTTFNVPDSSGFIILATSQAARLAAAALPQYVTSLPSSPVDGQTVVYAADASNGVMWTLRYRAAGGTYKWEVIGTSDLTAYSTTAVQFTSTTPALLATGDKVTVPLAGDYVASAGGNIYGATGGSNSILTLYADVGSGAATTSRNSYADNGSGRIAVSLVARINGVSANTAIEPRYSREAGAGSPYASDRWLSVTPVRVG